MSIDTGLPSPSSKPIGLVGTVGLPLPDVDEDDDEEELLLELMTPEEDETVPTTCGVSLRLLSELEQPARPK
jgi:hypothetical protein